MAEFTTINPNGAYVSDEDGILRCGQCVVAALWATAATKQVGQRTDVEDIFGPLHQHNPQPGDDFCSDCDKAITHTHQEIA